VRKKILALAALPLVLAFIGGCGGSGHTTPPPSNNVPVVVSISDTTPAAEEALPAGVNLVSVQASVTGVCLLTSSDTGDTTCPTGQTAFPATGGSPSTVQFTGLATPSQPDVISNGAVTANTYVGALVTLGSPLVATVSVDPGDSFSDGTTTCDNTTGTTPLFCPLAPVASTTSETVTFPSPITLTAGTPVSIVVGLDVTGSLTASTSTPPVLAFTPIVTVTQGTTAADGDLIDVNNVTGTVQSISATSLTLVDSATGLPLTLNIGSGTTVTNYNTVTATCATANTIGCPQVGDVVTLSYGASNTNPVQFTALNINGNPGILSTNAFQGTIIATTPAPEVVVTAVAAGNTVPGIAVGQVLDLSFTTTPPAVFSNSTGAALPVTQTFASPTDLVVGQNVLIDTSCPTVASVTTCVFTPPAAVTAPTPQGPGSVTADAIELLPSNVSGIVGDLNSTDLTFTVSGLNSLFTGNGITGFSGTASTSATYSGSLTAFTDMTSGDTYFYNGFVLNSGTPSTPALYTIGFWGAPGTGPAAAKAKTR
jgi:hypothetical protein